MKRRWIVAAALLAFVPSLATAGPEARCKACHTFTEKHKMGPGLKGVFGSKAGTRPGYRYEFTKYIQGEPWVWDEAHLRAFLDDSNKAVRKFTGNPKARTKMPPQHIRGAQADAIIEFLKNLK